MAARRERRGRLTKGVKTFSLFRRVKGGKPERITLGRFPSMTVEQARKQAAKINLAIESGANPADAKRAHKAEQTFGELFQDYLERHAKPQQRTCGLPPISRTVSVATPLP